VISGATVSPRRRHLALLLGLWAVLVLAALVFRSALGPAVAAVFLAYVAAPLVDRLAAVEFRGRSLPRWAAVIALYLGLSGVVALFVFAAVPQLYRELVRMTVELRDFVNSLTPEKLGAYVGAAEVWLERHGIPVDLGGPPVEGRGPRLTIDLEDALRESLAGTSAWIRHHLLDVVGFSRRLVSGLVEGIFLFFFVLMVAAFLLVDTRRVRAWFRGLVPEGWGPGFDEFLARVDVRLSGVVRGQLVICLVNGVLTLGGLLLLKVKFALVLALVATILTFIPIFG
jgi:predicted PurR-regulated permease PerM